MPITGLKHVPQSYTLRCVEWNARHARFTCFDPAGVSCGELTVLAEDAVNFLLNSWRGRVQRSEQVPAGLYAAHPYIFDRDRAPRGIAALLTRTEDAPCATRP